MSPLWLAVACHGDRDGPPSEDGEPTGHTGSPAAATADTGTPGETGETADTGGPCVPVPEVAMNDADDDCDGWADEYGQDWPRIAVLGSVLMRATDYEPLGMDLDAGLGSDGAFWVAAGPDPAYPYPLAGAVVAANLAGDTLELRTDADLVTLDRPGIVHLDGTTAPLAIGHRLFEGTGSQTLSDAVVSGSRLDVSDARTIGALGEDVDGDGFDELVNFHGGSLAGAGTPGRLFIQDGPVTSPTWDNVRADIWGSYPPYDSFADLVGEVADLTGDGIPEIPAFSEEEAGRTWLIPGDVAGTVAVQDVATATVYGEDPGDDAGWGAVCGDANGDGYQDLALGSPLADGRWGEAYLVLGPIAADRWLADADARVVADWADDYCGVAQDFLPDEDGDGMDELAVACPRSLFGSAVRAPGRIQLYRGSDVGGTLGLAEAAAVYVGEGPYDLAGKQLRTRHDADGDGWADLVVAVPADTSYDGYTHGTVYLVPGPLLP